jgi:hypothetical protein
VLAFTSLVPSGRAEGDDGLGQGQLLLTRFRSVQEVRREIILDTSLVAERVEDVGQVAVGPKRQRRIHYVEVEVGRCGVSRVAELGELLAALQ